MSISATFASFWRDTSTRSSRQFSSEHCTARRCYITDNAISHTAFFRFNEGLASRFQDRIFEFKDYTDGELTQLWKIMTKTYTKEAPWKISAEAAAIGARRVGRFRGLYFGNARCIEKLLARSIESAKIRGVTLESKEILIHDIIGPPPMENPEVHALMRKIDRPGWEAPKRFFESMLLAMKESYEAELRGEAPSSMLQLNRVLRGPPGTGKSEVARLYGELLRITRFVSKGHFVEKKAGDFEGHHEGDTAVKVRQIFTEAASGILFIDETPNLCKSHYGKLACGNIVEEMQAQDIAVVLAGYDEDFLEFFKQNPGLSSRFGDRHSDIKFENYQIEILFEIATRELLNQRATYERDQKSVQDAIRQRIKRDMQLPRFGNARDVKE